MESKLTTWSGGWCVLCAKEDFPYSFNRTTINPSAACAVHKNHDSLSWIMISYNDQRVLVSLLFSLSEVVAYVDTRY